MNDTKNIFQVISEGVATTNLNVVDLYKLTEELTAKVNAIYDALYPEPNTPGTDDTKDK